MNVKKKFFSFFFFFSRLTQLFSVIIHDPSVNAQVFRWEKKDKVVLSTTQKQTWWCCFVEADENMDDNEQTFIFSLMFIFTEISNESNISHRYSVIEWKPSNCTPSIIRKRQHRTRGNFLNVFCVGSTNESNLFWLMFCLETESNIFSIVESFFYLFTWISWDQSYWHEESNLKTMNDSHWSILKSCLVRDPSEVTSLCQTRFSISIDKHDRHEADGLFSALIDESLTIDRFSRIEERTEIYPQNTTYEIIFLIHAINKLKYLLLEEFESD